MIPEISNQSKRNRYSAGAEKPFVSSKRSGGFERRLFAGFRIGITSAVKFIWKKYRSMATEKALIDAVRDSLMAEGELGRIKAEMRKEVIKLLDSSNKDNTLGSPKPSQELVLLNEMIREYLDWIGYKYSSTVFTAECNLPKQPMSRSFMVGNLGVKETDKTEVLPLLCSLLDTFKNLKSTEMYEQ